MTIGGSGLRIGELADRLGVTTDTLRFYERAGWLPRPTRGENGYRRYAVSDMEHLRLLIDLRRMDLPLDEAARLASWCHAGHCASTTASLPGLIGARRAEIAHRMEGLRALDDRLADLERHLAAESGSTLADRLTELQLVGAATACCDAAAAVTGTAEGTCACCAGVNPPN
ncbi:MAG TPA: MerR family DNA-binding transcriptional regulator [Candidatus Limnocylindria bacterium]|nr:MerR family DNA-binding transcriptional regulator [Candidatus Limnocylindria bacterium]